MSEQLKNNKIVFSVITIVCNGEKEIERTIKSVISQTHPHLEYILIDGASTDSTMQIVEKYKDHFSEIVSEPDGGIYNAMNKGLKIATGDYVIFANSGDYMAGPDVLRNVADAANKEKTLPDLIYGNYCESFNGALLKEIPCYSHKRIWYGMFASHQSIFYRLGMLRERNIYFDENYKIAADYKMTLQSVINSSSFLKVPICISVFDTTGVSCQNQDLGLLEADRARKEVLHMSWFMRKIVILLSKTSRYMKKNLGSIYKHLRGI